MEGHYRRGWSVPRSAVATILLYACVNWHWGVLARPIFVLVDVIVAVFAIEAVVGLLSPTEPSRRSYSHLLIFLGGLLLATESVHDFRFNLLDELLSAQNCILVNLLGVAAVLGLLRALLVTQLGLKGSRSCWVLAWGSVALLGRRQ